MDELSAREKEVLALLSLGHRNKDIAEELFISTETVKSHLRAVFRKLGVSNRCEAISLYLRAGDHARVGAADAAADQSAASDSSAGVRA